MFLQDTKVVSIDKDPKQKKTLPGSSQPQDLGSVSYKDNTTTDTSQKIESIETTATIVTETFQNEEKILPEESAIKQYEFATSFLKEGDYPTAERAFREFVLTNPEHELAEMLNIGMQKLLEFVSFIQMQHRLILKVIKNILKVRKHQ